MLKQKRFLMMACVSMSVMFTLHPQKAHAFATSADIAALKVATTQAISDAAKNTVKSITGLGDNVVDAMLSFSSQMSSNTAQQQKLATNIADTQDQRAVQLKVEEARNDAQKSATSGASLCNNITGVAATQNLEKLVTAWRMNAVQAVSAYGAGHLTGQKQLATASTLADLYETDHCANSANALDYQVGRCSQGPNGTPTQKGTAASKGIDNIITTSDDQNADLILNATDMTPEQQSAMKRFIPLMTDPEPIGQGVAASMKNTEDRKKFMRQLDSIRLKKTIAQSVVSGLVGENTVLKSAGSGDSQDKAAAWAEATAAKVAGYTKTCVDGNCKYFPNGVSYHDILQLEAKYWYYNLTYGVMASAQGQAPSQKDLNEMTAFSLILDYQKYERLREIDMTLAGILSIMVQHQQHEIQGQ